MLSPTTVDSVFQFVLLRPPVAQPTPTTVSVTTGSDFQGRLRTAVARGDKGAARQLADSFVSGERFAADVGELAYGRQYAEVATAIDEEDGRTFAEIIGQVFGMAPGALADDGRFRFDRETVFDSLVASKFTSDQGFSTEDLEGAARIIDLIDRAGEGEAIAAKPDSVSRPLLFDPGAAPDDDQDDADDLGEAEVEDLGPQLDFGGRYGRYRDAIAELQAAERNGGLTYVASENVTIKKTPGSRFPFFNRGVGSVQVTAAIDDLRLRDDVALGLSADTRGVLEELGIDPTTTPVASSANQIHQALIGMETEPEPADPQSMVFSQMMMMAPPDGGWMAPQEGKPGAPQAAPSNPIRPAGIGDLLIVRQQITRYEGGEVAHIENILKGESKGRTHRRLDRQEDTLTIETEATRTDEQESATTERFELQREVASTIEADASAKLGASVSGSYGPTVEFTVSAELESSFSTSKSTQTASS